MDKLLEIITELVIMRQNVKWHAEKSYDHGAYDTLTLVIDKFEEKIKNERTGRENPNDPRR
jgi:hypothetical protein